MTTTDEPTVKEWQRIMAAQAHGNDPSPFRYTYPGTAPTEEDPWALAPSIQDVDNINLPRALLGSADEKLRKFGWTVTSTGCWEWNGGRLIHRGGYGQVKYAGEVMKAHRLAYETWVGPLDPGHFVCHTCDNPPCINPDHLFAGTPADNNWDKVRKGRARGGSMPGELHPSHVLTEAAVVEIRRRLQAGEKGAHVAREYGVTPAAISRIKKRQTWRHV